MPWSTPALKGIGEDPVERHKLAMRVEEVSKPCVEFALDTIVRGFGKQGGVPHCIISTRERQP